MEGLHGSLANHKGWPEIKTILIKKQSMVDSHVLGQYLL